MRYFCPDRVTLSQLHAKGLLTVYRSWNSARDNDCWAPLMTSVCDCVTLKNLYISDGYCRTTLYVMFALLKAKKLSSFLWFFGQHWASFFNYLPFYWISYSCLPCQDNRLICSLVLERLWTLTLKMSNLVRSACQNDSHMENVNITDFTINVISFFQIGNRGPGSERWGARSRDRGNPRPTF